MSFGALFLDVVQAFYRAIRELVVRAHRDTDLDDLTVAAIVRAAGLPPTAMQQLADRLRDRAALSRSNVDPHTVAMVEQCYQAPWFVCEGSGQVSLPQRSFFPGQPLADVLFEIQMAECMQDARTQLLAEGFIYMLPQSDQPRSLGRLVSCDPDDRPPDGLPMVDISYADDGTVILILPAAQLYSALSRTLVHVSEAFARRGHVLNVGPSKTAALIMWRGRGTKHARHAAWHEHQGHVQGHSDLLGQLRAPIVHNYIHLGAVFDANGAMTPEIRYRASTTAASLQVLRRRVFASDDLDIQHRLILADSLVMSGRQYNAGAWPVLTDAEDKLAHLETMKVYRAAARVRFQEATSQVSDEVVLARLRRPSPTTLLRAARLRLLGSLYHTGPKVAFAVVIAEWYAAPSGAARKSTTIGQWIQDLIWLRAAVKQCHELPMPDSDLCAWENLIRRSQPAWKRIIRIGVHAYTQYQNRLTLARHVESQFFITAHAAGVPARVYTDERGLLVPPPPPEIAHNMECPWCGMIFHRHRALRTHVARMHRQLSTLAKGYADHTGICTVCLLKYDARPHLIDHLSIDSPRCLLAGVLAVDNPAYHLHDPPRCSIADGHTNPVRIPRRHVVVPTTRVYGPLTQLATDIAELVPQEHARHVLLESDPYITPEACAALLPPPPAHPPDNDLPEQYPPVQHERYPTRMFLTAHYQGVAAQVLPTAIRRTEYYVLNLYCGRRRPGDIQTQIEWCHYDVDFAIIVLSVDIAIDPILGNMMRRETLEVWKGHIYAKRVVLSGGGPPCETWSAIRWAPDAGPPPLRSHDDFWGLLAITPRQMEQLRVGNELLGAMIELFAAHLTVGTCCWMEHPMPAGWRQEAVSSFFCPPLRAIMAAPGASVTDFDQCEHGQSARAPTRILSLRMNTLHDRLLETPGRGRCSHGRGAHEVLMGFDRTRDEWRTAKKKTYPPALCQVLADGIADAINHMRVTCDADTLPLDMAEEDELRGSLRAFFVRWDPYLGTDESWAPDFAFGTARRARVDPERHRFLPPEPAVPAADEAGLVFDPSATPREIGPVEAVEEQEYADAIAFVEGTTVPEHEDAEPRQFVPDPSEPPPPPQPVELTAEIRARIAANRAAARERRRQRLAQRIAPWTCQPEFGAGLFDQASN